jgi:G3E family GTPase
LPFKEATRTSHKGGTSNLGNVVAVAQRNLRALYRLDARRQDGRCPRFRRLVIETTGLANPNPVVHALQNDRRIAARFRLAAVIALVDATHAIDQLDAFDEAVAQIAAADVLLVSKMDLAGLRHCARDCTS